MCSPEDLYASERSEKESFQKCVHLDAQKLKAKITFYWEGMSLRHDYPP